MRRSAAALACSLAMLALPAYGADAAKTPIKIGDITSYSKIPDYVIPYKNAVQMAVDEINTDGGIHGRPLEVISIDAKGDPATSVKAAEDLVSREGVKVLMDCDLSNATMATSIWARQNKIPLINACATADTIMWDQGHDYVFRTTSASYEWISSAIDEAIKIHGDKMKNKRWATIAVNYESGHAGVEFTKVIARARGLNPQWATEQWPTLAKLEAGATVATIQREKPDILFVYIYANDLAKFVREGNKRGLFKDKIVIAPLLGWPENLDLLGAETPPHWISVGFPVDEIKDSGFVKFRDKYKASYKDPIKLFTVSGYNAVQAIVAALRQTKTDDPESIRDALANVVYTTPFGTEKFRKTDRVSNAVFWVGVTGVENGQAKLTNWHTTNVLDHLPTDAWILERRNKAGNKAH